MTDDRSLERAARSWIEAGPSRAPDHVVEHALLLVQTTPQERGLRALWRTLIMNRIALFGATAVAVVSVGLAGLLLWSGSNGSDVGGPPGPTAPATSSPGASAGAIHAIPAGTYATEPMDVADILAQLDADQSLSEAEKQSIVTDVLVIDGRTTLTPNVLVRDNAFELRLSRDGGPLVQDTAFAVTWIDDQSFQVKTACCGRTTYGITWEADAFRLEARSPASGNVETFVRRILFESQPFAPVP